MEEINKENLKVKNDTLDCILRNFYILRDKVYRYIAEFAMKKCQSKEDIANGYVSYELFVEDLNYQLSVSAPNNKLKSVRYIVSQGSVELTFSDGNLRYNFAELPFDDMVWLCSAIKSYYEGESEDNVYTAKEEE